jgi:hypothetical protein
MPNASTATAVARARHKPRVRSDLHRQASPLGPMILSSPSRTGTTT